MKPLPPNLLITVCNACERASCWQGEFYCDSFKTAKLKEVTVRRLQSLKLEHPSYWEKDARAMNWRQTPYNV